MSVPSSASSTTNGTKRGGRGLTVLLGVILLCVVVAAVALGRGGLGGGGTSDTENDGAGGGLRGGAGVTKVHGVIGSEKRGYFEDPDVVARLKELGYEVSISTAGSRQIATGTDIAAQDFVFPSSAPATQKVREQVSGASAEFPFFSPMAVASWQTIADILEEQGVVHQENGAYVLDMAKYVDLAQSGTRWRDLSDAFPSPRNVQIRSTDIRTSNSAAMYLSVLAWEFQQRDPARGDDVGYLVEQISPFFTGQGYSESSSSGPFAEYLSQGMGAAPMVMVYEAQFIGEQMSPTSRIRDDMVLFHLSPTVLANHGIVGVTPEGKELARLLTADAQLQQLAARHGFRPATAGSLAEEMEQHGLQPPADYVNSIDPPNYDRLEQLIDGVGMRYGTLAPPPKQEEEE
ncbi:hypothetical protein JKI95_01095 [Corynebacterium aquatimens]|uniref:hypothetical protein n=1 Tax=Corynebacterium TaxID=1716 RepID=UPI001F41DAF2|nr:MULTISPECIES: hypothetical protein [Corynebacterium]QYH19786.1 hypothetical protein JKI95_01095 [Corynebacterium aquatimens]UIZ93088.1 hypothetical protein JZY91_05010 [Corynebacterium sp. CNCTC7651]